MYLEEKFETYYKKLQQNSEKSQKPGEKTNFVFSILTHSNDLW